MTPSSTSEEQSSSASVLSILDRLKDPSLSVFARKQKVRTNPPRTGKRHSSARGNSSFAGATCIGVSWCGVSSFKGYTLL